MRKLVILGVVGGMLGMGMPAMADVFVRADIDKLKTIRIVENITITKDIDIFAAVSTTVIKAAEADTLLNQVNTNNEACTNCDEKSDIINNSINDNEGVINTNQASGNMNNQGNAYSIAIDVQTLTPPENGARLEDDGFAEAQSAVEQNNGAVSDTVVDTSGPSGTATVNAASNTVNTVNILFRDAEITDSVNDNQGIVGVNEASGNMNNQGNAVALAVAFSTSGVALSEADLGQVNAFNFVGESDAGGTPFIGISKRATISGSITGNAGIVGTNQTAGNMANQANNVSLAWVQGNGGLGQGAGVPAPPPPPIIANQ